MHIALLHKIYLTIIIYIPANGSAHRLSRSLATATDAV